MNFFLILTYLIYLIQPLGRINLAGSPMDLKTNLKPEKERKLI
jgi:hypothetical protein